MCSCMLVNKKGMSVVMVMAVLGLVGITAVTIMSLGSQKRKISQQMNVSVSASLIKQKLVGIILSPQSWQVTQIKNSRAFSQFTEANPPSIDIYNPDSTLPYYQTTDVTAGFDLKGNPCAGFDAVSGNDNCPFRYEINLTKSYIQNGNWIHTLHFSLLFKPASAQMILNAGSPLFTFDLTRNIDEKSVETACTLVNGYYDASMNSCSVQVTKPVPVCNSGMTYRGPAANQAANNCDLKKVNLTACNTPDVVKGFSQIGTPICGAPL